MNNPLLPILYLLAAIAPAFGAVTVAPQADGLHVTSDSDTIGFTLPYPLLVSADTKKVFKPTDVKVTSGTVAVLTYEGGGEIDLTLDSSGTMILKETNISPDAHSVQFRMEIPLRWNNGATWQAGDAAPQPFPPSQSAKPHMYQGNAPTLTLRDPNGKGVTITIQKYSYQEVNDERPWGTQSFSWMTMATNADTLTYSFTDAAPPPPAPASAPSTNAAPNP